MKMYRLIIVMLAAIIFNGNLLAQDTISKKKPRRTQDNFVFDINWNGLLNQPDSMTLSPWSRGFNLYALYDAKFSKTSCFSFAIGAGISNQNYYWNQTLGIAPDTIADDIRAEFNTLKDAEFLKNKLTTTYGEIPLEFRFRSKPDKNERSWKVAVGGKVGYRINRHSKLINRNDEKFKGYQIPFVNQFTYGPTFRFGYGQIMLYGFYSASTFLNPDKDGAGSPNAIAIGLSIVPL